MEEVYDSGGECLGDEYVNLNSLQLDSKKAIMQIIYIDGLVDDLIEQTNNVAGWSK